MKKYNLDYCFRMFFKQKYILSLLLFCISFLIACSSALYKPNQDNISKGANLEELIQGRKIYVKKCSSCHSLVLPEKHNTEEWKIWLDKMQQKSNINAKEKASILKYLLKGQNY